MFLPTRTYFFLWSRFSQEVFFKIIVWFMCSIFYAFNATQQTFMVWVICTLWRFMCRFAKLALLVLKMSQLVSHWTVFVVILFGTFTEQFFMSFPVQLTCMMIRGTYFTRPVPQYIAYCLNIKSILTCTHNYVHLCYFILLFPVEVFVVCTVLGKKIPYKLACPFKWWCPRVTFY